MNMPKGLRYPAILQPDGNDEDLAVRNFFKGIQGELEFPLNIAAFRYGKFGKENEDETGRL